MLLSTFHSLMQSKGIVLLSESRYSQRQYTICRKLKSNFPKEKETAPQFSRWTWEFESSSTKQVAHQWDTENLLVDMVTKGTRAQLSTTMDGTGAPPMNFQSQRHDWLSTCLWKILAPYSHLGLGKSLPASLVLCLQHGSNVISQEMNMNIVPGCSYLRGWTIHALPRLNKVRKGPTGSQTAQFLFPYQEKQNTMHAHQHMKSRSLRRQEIPNPSFTLRRAAVFSRPCRIL